MSTIALPVGVASTATKTKSKPSFFERLIKAREKDAMRRIHAYLLAQSDRSLKDLGYTPKDIAALRENGQIKVPR